MTKQKQPPKAERIQVPAFWISKTQSAFGYEFLENSQMDKNALKGERSLVIRQSLTAGLSLHNLDPKLVDLINGYGKHLTFKTLIALLQMLDPDLAVPHVAPVEKVTLEREPAFILKELKSLVSALEATELEKNVGSQSLNAAEIPNDRNSQSNFVNEVHEESRGLDSEPASPGEVVSRVEGPVELNSQSDTASSNVEQPASFSDHNVEESPEVKQRTKKKNKFINSLTQ